MKLIDELPPEEKKAKVVSDDVVSDDVASCDISSKDRKIVLIIAVFPNKVGPVSSE